MFWELWPEKQTKHLANWVHLWGIVDIIMFRKFASLNHSQGGRGGSSFKISESTFWLFLIEVTDICQMLLVPWKINVRNGIYCQAKVSACYLCVLCNNIVNVIFNWLPWKKNLKPIFFYSFWEITLKLLGYVLGINTKICIRWLFDLGLLKK